MAISGLILAGGAGLRVQGRDKGLLEWQGRPLVAHVAQRLRPQVAQVLISCNRNQEHYAGFGELAPADLRGDFQGPLAGLEAAAGAILHPLLLVVPCDSPKLPADLALRLSARLQAEPRLDVVWAHCAGRDHYLHALMRTSCLDTLPAFLDSGQRAVRRWYGQLRAEAVEFADETTFANLNQAGR